MDYPRYGQTMQAPSGPVYSSVENRNPWKTGYLTRLPWAGLLAVLGSILGIAACAGILVASNGQPIAHWRFQPTVYLAIASTLTNIFLAFALSEGADIAWWRKASSDRTTVADLHRVWTHGRSFKDALLAGKKITWVAAACLLATIAQINSPLLQRASTVSIENVATTSQITFRASASIPRGATGYTSGRGYTPSLFTGPYVEMVKAWNDNASIPAVGTGCLGICSARIRSLGLAVNCSTSRVPFSLIPKTFNNGSVDVTDQSMQGVNVFQSTWLYSVGMVGNMTLRTTYKNTTSCSGDLLVEQCLVRAATMEYPVIIDGNRSSVVLDPATDIYDDKVATILDIPVETIAGPSTLGGYFLALQNKYFSNATMRFTGAVPYTITTTGNTALQYVVINDKNYPYMNCSTSFRSPTTNILNSARELMFRTSIAIANESTPIQTVSASDSGPRPIYKSNYYYLAGAISITVIAIVAVLSIFRGYSDLGRNPTMSPIEIAKAFNAPMLQSHDGNAEADELLDEVGMRSVKYGAVQDGFAMGPMGGFGGPTEYKPYNPHVQEINPNVRRRLAMGEETQVQQPQVGETFTG